MPKRCGDLAQFHYSVKDATVGRLAVTRVVRQKDKNLTAFALEVLEKKERRKVKWPDQREPTSAEWVGGRRADFKGLDKATYKDKFAKQSFDLELHVSGGSVRSSKDLKINGYPDVARDHQHIGIPMPTEMWKQVGHLRVLKWSDPAGTAFKAPGMNCGNFHIEVKDGVVQITIKLQLHSTRKLWIKSVVFGAIKKGAEAFWNTSRIGFSQWTWHRADCKRGKNCGCKLVMDGKGRYTQAGCCKVPVRVNLEQGPDNPVEIQFLSLAQRKELKKQGFVSGLRADTAHLWYPENNPHTFAHEIGHMMGFPDQYWYGVIASGSVHAAGTPGAGFPNPLCTGWPIDDSSIMGQNMARAKEIHFAPTWFKQWVAAHVEDVKVLSR